MHEQDTLSAVETRSPTTDQDLQAKWHRVVGRRSFLKGIGIAGVAAVPGSALLATEATARSSRPTDGDVAILCFLAAAEIIERSLAAVQRARRSQRRQQGLHRRPVQSRRRHVAVQFRQHRRRTQPCGLNAYLSSKGAATVNLDEFRKLPSSQATGAKQTGAG